MVTSRVLWMISNSNLLNPTAAPFRGIHQSNEEELKYSLGKASLYTLTKPQWSSYWNL